MIMKDIVLERLNSIQNEYLKLLERVGSGKETPWENIVDQINLFWLQHKKIILFALKNYFPPQKTFLFTAATFLDYDAKEHFSFAICDGIRIIDDSVSIYGNLIGTIENATFNKTISEQLSYAIEDNIKVLKNCAQHFYILPISYLYDSDLETIVKGSESVFLKLFEPSFDSIEAYFGKIVTVNDLEKSLKPGIERSLIFFSDDDINLALSERINNYIQDVKGTIELEGAPIGKVFFSAIYSPIVQALKILMMCAQYSIIPYLRYNVAFHNFSLILSNYPDQKQKKIIEDKVYSCFLIYKAFDLDSVELSDFDMFVEKLKDTNVFELVYQKVSNRDSTTSATAIGDFAYQQIETIVNSFERL